MGVPGEGMWQWQRPAFQSDLPPGFGQAIALGASVCSSVRWTQQWCLPGAAQEGAPSSGLAQCGAGAGRGQRGSLGKR